MQLRKWLFEKDMLGKDFAAAIGVSPQTVYLIARKRRIPSVTVAAKIVEYTNKEVTMDELRPPELMQPTRCPCCGRPCTVDQLNSKKVEEFYKLTGTSNEHP